MMQLKACPRCKGDMYKSGDLHGPYMQCAQCGHTQDLPARPLPKITGAIAESAMRQVPSASPEPDPVLEEIQHLRGTLRVKGPLRRVVSARR